MDMKLAVVVLVLMALAGWALGRALRGRWDLIIEHSRDGVRHLLAAILMLGTLAGTVFTFSAGRLSIAGVWEAIVSVGGIAAALECGVIYTGWYIGQLDQRIHSAKRADIREQLLEQQSSLYKWFYVTAGISAIANFVFRLDQLHSWLLAGFVSAAPIVLIILFTIKLRPLPRDYADIGRQANQRGLVMLASQAQTVMMRSLRRIGSGQTLSAAESAQLAIAVELVRIYATGEQQQALDHIINQQQGPAGLLEAPSTVAATGGAWLTTADIQQLYQCSERTAQTWMSQTPGRRRQAHSKRWEAPAGTIYAAHGVPQAGMGGRVVSGSAPRRKRGQAPSDADETRPGEGDTLAPVGDAPSAVIEASVSEVLGV